MRAGFLVFRVERAKHAFDEVNAQAAFDSAS